MHESSDSHFSRATNEIGEIEPSGPGILNVKDQL